MLGFRLARRALSFPGTLVSQTDQLLDHLAELHQQMRRAREDVARTNRLMVTSNEKLDTLIELSRIAIDRMERANAGIATTTEQVESLTPLAEEATQAMENATATLGQLPLVDEPGDR